MQKAFYDSVDGSQPFEDCRRMLIKWCCSSLSNVTVEKRNERNNKGLILSLVFFTSFCFLMLFLIEFEGSNSV